jgi:purine nucleosidase
MKVLLDTDIGSDIDDAVCLAYLLGQSRCELMGVTTVTGEAVRRAQMASVLCRIAGKEVPIYPGVEEPLVIQQKQPRAPQAEALSREEKDQRYPEGQAVEFLRRTIREHPGEIHLLTIGPLTNVGLLFGLDPEIPSLLAGLTAMAGVYLEQTRHAHPKEWNVGCDPHAAAIVLSKAPENTTLIGLDVTLQVTMSAREVKNRFTSPLLRRVAEFAEIWFEKAERITFHDPLAAAALFNPGICGFQSGVVRVELGGGGNSKEAPALGATPFEPVDGAEAAAHRKDASAEGAVTKPARVATTVDADAFFREYFSVFR